VDAEPLITHDKLAAALFAVHDSWKNLAKSRNSAEATMAGTRKHRKTKAEREAWDAHVDETLRRLREAAERIQARGRKTATPPEPT
jgi:hypothetical protein